MPSGFWETSGIFGNASDFVLAFAPGDFWVRPAAARRKRRKKKRGIYTVTPGAKASTRSSCFLCGAAFGALWEACACLWEPWVAIWLAWPLSGAHKGGGGALGAVGWRSAWWCWCWCWCWLLVAGCRLFVCVPACVCVSISVFACVFVFRFVSFCLPADCPARPAAHTQKRRQVCETVSFLKPLVSCLFCLGFGERFWVVRGCPQDSGKRAEFLEMLVILC